MVAHSFSVRKRVKNGKKSGAKYMIFESILTTHRVTAIFWMDFIVPTTHETIRNFLHNYHNQWFISQIHWSQTWTQVVGNKDFHTEELNSTVMDSGFRSRYVPHLTSLFLCHSFNWFFRQQRFLLDQGPLIALFWTSCVLPHGFQILYRCTLCKHVYGMAAEPFSPTYL